MQPVFPLPQPATTTRYRVDRRFPRADSFNTPRFARALRRQETDIKLSGWTHSILVAFVGQVNRKPPQVTTLQGFTGAAFPCRL